MLKKLCKGTLGIALAFVSILPIQFVNSLVKAEETEKFIIVDDTQTNRNENHYFTYHGGFDQDTSGGSNGGWVADANAHTNQSQEAKTQHWVWRNNDGGAEARKRTYEFTFVGTGVEIYGIPNDPVNVYQLDEEEPVSKTYTKTGNVEVLFSAKNLENKKHVVKVKLPDTGNVSGLQVCYAKVFGAKEDPNKPVNIKDSIDPTIQRGVNYFEFVGVPNYDWHVSSGEAYIDFKNGSPDAEKSYYEVKFIGNKIEIEASKSHNHGKVKFSVDGKHEKEVDLYAPSRLNNQIVYEVEGLADGKEHVLKAQTMNAKNDRSSSVVNQVTKAHIYHAPYILKSLEVETPVTMIKEAEHKLDVKLNPTYANPENLKFESKNTDIATVNDKGIVTAKKPGETEIHVSAKGVETKVAKIIVKEQVKAMSGSIVDENLQWTQTKREEVSKMGTTSKNLTAWQADKAIAEFVIYAKQSSLKNVTLSVSDFTDGKNIISKDNVSATFIKSTKAFTGMPGWNYHPENYPVETETNRAESSDILYTTNPVNISYDKVQPVWVEINVPKGTPTGVYTGTVKVASEDVKDNALSFTFNVKVKDVELPDASTYGDTFDVELWQYPYSSAEYYDVEPFSDEHMKILESIMLKYKSVGGHAITATISEDAWEKQTYSQKDIHYPSMVKWNLVKGSFDSQGNISKDFKFEYDFTDFDKWVQFNKDLGIGDKIVLYSIAPWHGSFTYWVGDQLKYTKYREGNETYRKVWGDFFRAMVDHLDEKGWFDDAYVGIDERRLSAKAFDLLDTIENKDGKTLKTAGAMDSITKGDHPQLARRIDDLNIGDNIVQDPKMKDAFDQLLKDRKEKGLRTTLYSCTGHAPGNFSLSAPGESYWSMMFAYKSGTAGFLRWAYDAWVKDPLNDTTHSSFEAGDCFLIFPDLKDAENPTAKSSLRLEKMAQGVRDINKLIMMSKEYPELQADIDALLNNVQTKYEQSGYFLTDVGKVAVAKDMNTVHDGIDAITDKYLALREKDDIAKAKKDLADLLDTAKPYLEKADEYTKESFEAFKEAYNMGENLLESDEVSLGELRISIATLTEKMNGLVLIKGEAWEELTPATPVNPDENKPVVPEKPSTDDKTDKVEDEEKPNTGATSNAALLWTITLGAGAAAVALAKKKKA